LTEANGFRALNTYRFAVIGSGRGAARRPAARPRAGLTVVSVGVHAPASVDRSAAPPHLPLADAVLAAVASGEAGAPGTPTASGAAGAARDTGAAGTPGAAGVIWLTVPDDALRVVAREVAEVLRGARHPDVECFVVHSSGLGALSLLAPVQSPGVHTLSLHPLQTFASVGPASGAAGPASGADVLSGVPFAVTAGDAQAAAFGRALVERLGGVPFDLPDTAKPLYHLAAAVASNLLVALESQAAELMNQAVGAGAATSATQAAVDPQGLALLGPLVRTTLANLLRLGPERALTGPVARGDVSTVRAHLALLAGFPPRFAAAYRALSLQALTLAAPRLDDENVRALQELLEPPTRLQPRGVAAARAPERKAST
jgi:predicted short-subunit dehydrogenase-like oxidoreductase (DUF2520 family)